MRNESAFPYVINSSLADFEVTPGLSKREYIAAQIYGDILLAEVGDFKTADEIANLAVTGADALIKALSQSNYICPEPSVQEFSVPVPGDPDYDIPNSWVP